MLPSGNDAAFCLAKYFGKFLFEKKGYTEKHKTLIYAQQNVILVCFISFKKRKKIFNIFFFVLLGNNDAKPNNVESAEGLTTGMSSDPYEASVSAALSSMNINSEAAAMGKSDF